MPPVLRFLAALLVAVGLVALPDGASGAALDASSGAASPPAPVWAWPVPAPHAVARPYVAPAHAYGPGHRGVDLRAAPGTEIRAPADGVVHFAGVVVDRPVLSLAHAGDVLSSFEPVESPLHAGDRVRRGDVIGTLLPGHCTGGCLHLGARVAGDYVSPLRFLGGIPRAILLPVRR